MQNLRALCLFLASLLFLSACSSSYKSTNSGSNDDIYFSTKDQTNYDDVTQSTDESGTSFGEYKTVYDDAPSGAQHNRESQEPEYVNTESYTDESGDTYITNNYYEDSNSDYVYDDYYDYAYASRLRRFYQPTYSYGYYDTYYTNSYHYSYDPYDYGVSIYLGYPWWGYNNHTGWNHHGNYWGYNQHHQHGWVNYYNQHHSYGGHYDPYAYGYGYGYGSGYGYYGYGSGHGYGDSYGKGYGYYGYGNNTGGNYYYNSYDATNTYYGPRYATASNSIVTHTSLAEAYEKEHGQGQSINSYTDSPKNVKAANIKNVLPASPVVVDNVKGNHGSQVSTPATPVHSTAKPLVNDKPIMGLTGKAPVKSTVNGNGNPKPNVGTAGGKVVDKSPVSNTGYISYSTKPVKVVRPKENVGSTNSGHGYSSKPEVKPTRNSSYSYNKPNNAYGQKGKTYNNSSYTKPRSNNNSHSSYSKPKSSGTSRPSYSKPKSSSSYSRPKQSTTQPRSSTPRSSAPRTSAPRTSTQRSTAPSRSSASPSRSSSSPSRSSSTPRTSSPRTSRPR
ncbi:MAG: hypothetical protein COB85_05620 [Bacteroidetes bacterium]|nr:MAG: hypothetical protein COB85_05620 [Bacteroidota bacterium]